MKLVIKESKIENLEEGKIGDFFKKLFGIKKPGTKKLALQVADKYKVNGHYYLKFANKFTGDVRAGAEEIANNLRQKYKNLNDDAIRDLSFAFMAAAKSDPTPLSAYLQRGPSGPNKPGEEPPKADDPAKPEGTPATTVEQKARAATDQFLASTHFTKLGLDSSATQAAHDRLILVFKKIFSSGATKIYEAGPGPLSSSPSAPE